MPRKKEAGKVGGRDAHTKKASTTKEKRNQKKKITEQVKKVAQSIKTEKNVKGGKVTIKPMAASSTGKSVVLTELLLDDKWKKSLSAEFDLPYFKTLQDTLASEYKQGKEIFPPMDLIFNALHLTPLDKVKVVILGQDPYHDNGQAMGLSFSVPKGITVPPSLRNMYKELERDTKIKGFIKPDHGNLEAWAKQGVLLLNATLTVEAHQPNSHAKFGWQKFTDGIIKVVSEECKHVVFILWGGFAHKKEKLIDSTKHQVIKTAHPSPLSFNKFNGCNCFSDCNSALTKLGVSPIDWSL